MKKKTSDNECHFSCHNNIFLVKSFFLPQINFVRLKNLDMHSCLFIFALKIGSQEMDILFCLKFNIIWNITFYVLSSSRVHIICRNSQITNV